MFKRLFSALLLALALASSPAVAQQTFKGIVFSLDAGNVASASTVNLCNVAGGSMTITGTTTITSFGTCQAGTTRKLKFAGAVLLTYNATSLVIPGAANWTTAAGDVFWFTSAGSGNWYVSAYALANGQAIAGSGGSGTVNVVKDGSTTVSNPTQVIFAGAGAVVSNTGGNATVTVAGGSGGSAESHSANNTSTTLDFTSCIDGSVDSYRFEIKGLTFATSTANLKMRVETGGGHTPDTGSNYEWTYNSLTSGASGSQTAGSSVAFNQLAPSVVTPGAFGGAVDIFHLIWHNLNSTTLRKHYTALLSFEDSSPHHIGAVLDGDWLTTGTAVTGIQFFSDSGNLVAGTIACYREPN